MKSVSGVLYKHICLYDYELAISDKKIRLVSHIFFKLCWPILIIFYSVCFNGILCQYFHFFADINCEAIWHMPILFDTMFFYYFHSSGSSLVFQNWLKTIWQGQLDLQYLFMFRTWSGSILSTFCASVIWCEQSFIPWARVQNRSLFSAELQSSVSIRFVDIADPLMWRKLCMRSIIQ